MAVLPDHRFRRDAPDLGGPAAELADGVARRLDRGQPAGEGGAAAFGDVVVAERAGIGDDGADLVVGDAELFRRHHATWRRGSRRYPACPAASATVPSMLMLSETQVWPPKLNQKPAGDAAALVLARAAPCNADASSPLPGSGSGRWGRRSGRRRISCPPWPRSSAGSRSGSMPSLWASSSITLSTAKADHRRARRAIGGLLRPVDRRRRSRPPSHSPDRSRRRPPWRRYRPASRGRRRPGSGARIRRAVMRPSLVAPILTPDGGAGGRAGGAEHLLAAHHHLHRLARFARQRERHRLEEHRRLAAEAAADLRGGDAELGDVHAEERAQTLRTM